MVKFQTHPMYSWWIMSFHFLLNSFFLTSHCHSEELFFCVLSYYTVLEFKGNNLWHQQASIKIAMPALFTTEPLEPLMYKLLNFQLDMTGSHALSIIYQKTLFNRIEFDLQLYIMELTILVYFYCFLNHFKKGVDTKEKIWHQENLLFELAVFTGENTQDNITVVIHVTCSAKWMELLD